MDLWVREARLFKYGSGTGSNFSRIRGEGGAERHLYRGDDRRRDDRRPERGDHEQSEPNRASRLRSAAVGGGEDLAEHCKIDFVGQLRFDVEANLDELDGLRRCFMCLVSCGGCGHSAGGGGWRRRIAAAATELEEG